MNNKYSKIKSNSKKVQIKLKEYQNYRNNINKWKIKLRVKKILDKINPDKKEMVIHYKKVNKTNLILTKDIVIIKINLIKRNKINKRP